MIALVAAGLELGMILHRLAHRGADPRQPIVGLIDGALYVLRHAQYRLCTGSKSGTGSAAIW